MLKIITMLFFSHKEEQTVTEINVSINVIIVLKLRFLYVHRSMCSYAYLIAHNPENSPN